jgi:tetratricopeptide (TPR) repeat protein
MALCFAADVHLARGEGQAAQERAEELMTLSTEQGFTQLLADGTMLRGAALVQQEQVEEGITQIQQGISAGRDTGFEMGRTGDLAGLAVAYAKAGQVEKGLTLVAEALALVDKTGERVSEAELYMLKGWLLLARSRENRTEAEAYFRQTVVIARR